MAGAQTDKVRLGSDEASSAREGEASSLRKSVTDLIPALRGYARSLTRDAVNADDLVQETLVRALANIHQFMPGTNLRAW